jgi:hypothetical protein
MHRFQKSEFRLQLQQATLAASPGDGAYDIPLSCLMSIDTPNLFAAGRTADGGALITSSEM